jgi:acyl carrier protein
MEGLTREQAYVLLNDIVRDELGDESVAVTEATRAADVQGWDSLVQIGVLAAAEIRFGVEIRAAEAERLATVGELVDLILGKGPRLSS